MAGLGSKIGIDTIENTEQDSHAANNQQSMQEAHSFGLFLISDFVEKVFGRWQCKMGSINKKIIIQNKKKISLKKNSQKTNSTKKKKQKLNPNVSITIVYIEKEKKFVPKFCQEMFQKKKQK